VDSSAGTIGTSATERCWPVTLTPCPRIIHFAGWEILDINDCQAGAPNLLPEGLRWIKSRTGIAISLPTSHHAPWEKPPSSTDNLDLWPNGTALELPTKPILRQYLDAYLSSLMHKVFPVVDSSLFPLTIRAAYQQRGPGLESPNPSARACVFAFTALVSCLGQVDPGSSVARPPPVPCREYIMQARRILPAILQEPPNLDALQTTLLLVGLPSCYVE
jgi:hypothetical protein